MRHLTNVLIVLFAGVLLGGPIEAQDEKGIPILVVSGANNHDWEWTTPSLVRILENSGRFDVSVTTTPDTDLADLSKLKQLGAIVLDFNANERWSEAAQASFLDAVQGGVGVVVVHAANNAFPGWDEYEKLVGDLWRKGTGHGRFHPYDIDIVDRDHPVTATLPTILKHPDELYHKLVNTQNVERRVLAQAYSDPETGGTGDHEPMILVKSYGRGRVFHTPLGHVWRNVPASQASHRDPQFHAVIVRGTEWAATGRVTDGLARPNEIAAVDAKAGWRSLMEPSAWRGYGKEESPDGWDWIEGCLVHRAGSQSGDLVTVDKFEDFELAFEWKTAVAANGGVKYRVLENGGSPVAPEYQLLDDRAHEGIPATQKSASLYAMFPAKDTELAPWGYFNHARIVCRDGHIQHWLNGKRTVDITVGGDVWNTAKAASKFKDRADFGTPKAGHVALQDHGDEIWFRSIRIRDLAAEDEDSDDLLPPPDLAGWTPTGDAVYERDGDTLLGRAGPNRLQSFLVSDRAWADFVLELELRIEISGNSGVQFRSHVRDNGSVYGYQAEVDPSGRSWSGGLYDEGRRGWLDDLSEDFAARAAYRPNDWNHYRIEAIGPHLQIWVNGKQTADYLDTEDLEGHFGLQIHGGDPDIQMRWKNLRVVDLGRHRWEEVRPMAGFGAGNYIVSDGTDDITLRAEVRASEPQVILRAGGEGDDGVRVPLAENKHWKKGEWNTVVVHARGDRTAVQVNGRTIADRKGVADRGWMTLLHMGNDGEAREFQRLESEGKEIYGAPSRR